MKFYAALLAVLMVGIAVGQEILRDLGGGFVQQCNHSGTCGPAHYVGQPDPVDVPAIQETQKQTCATFTLDGDRKITKQNINDSCDGKGWTCAEKSRILEHDEQTPPKFWCRKVQQ